MVEFKQKTFSWWLTNYLYSRHNIDTAFLMTGGGIFHICNALSDHREKIKSLFFYHEQQAIFAAEGLSKLTNKISLVIGTSGPGATNLITGLVSSYQDSTPLLAITGQCKSNDYKVYEEIEDIRQAGTFDNDFTKFSDKYTKKVIQIKDINKGLLQVEEAINIAISDRPGPVVIEIPLDVQGSVMDENQYLCQMQKINNFKNNLSNKKINEEEILNKLKSKISNKKRITILAGRGCTISNSWKRIYEISQKFNLPIVTTYAAKEENLSDLPQWCGVVGLKGSYSGNNVLEKSDLIISIGNSLHQQTVGWEFSIFLENKEIIYVDIDKNLCVKYSKFKEILTLNLDLNNFIFVLNKLFKLTNTETKENIQSWSKTWEKLRSKNSILEVGKSFNGGFSLYHVLDKFNSISTYDSVIVADSGTTWYVTGQVLKLKKGQSFITNSAMGSMGFALPAAAGITANSKFHTYCFVGDGSLMTSLSSLWTISREKLSVTIIIINNLGFNSISNTQDKFGESNYYGSTYESGLAQLDFKEIANACSIEYIRVVEENSLTDNLISRRENPLIIDIFVDKKTTVVPYVKSILQNDGSFKSGSLNNLEPFIK